MARITVEDCLEKVDNQYDLVLLAKERTVQLNAGAPMLVEEDNDKRTIISLREIGDGKIDVKEVEASAIKRLRKEPDESEEQEEVEDVEISVAVEIGSVTVDPKIFALDNVVSVEIKEAEIDADVLDGESPVLVTLHHPMGTMDVLIDYSTNGGEYINKSAGLVRTARKVASGEIFAHMSD